MGLRIKVEHRGIELGHIEKGVGIVWHPLNGKTICYEIMAQITGKMAEMYYK